MFKIILAGSLLAFCGCTCTDSGPEPVEERTPTTVKIANGFLHSDVGERDIAILCELIHKVQEDRDYIYVYYSIDTHYTYDRISLSEDHSVEEILDLIESAKQGIGVND